MLGSAVGEGELMCPRPPTPTPARPAPARRPAGAELGAVRRRMPSVESRGVLSRGFGCISWFRSVMFLPGFR